MRCMGVGVCDTPISSEFLFYETSNFIAAITVTITKPHRTHVSPFLRAKLAPVYEPMRPERKRVTANCQWMMSAET